MSEPDYMDSIEACAAHYGDDAAAMRKYLISGHKRAMGLDNRGPIERDVDGNLARDIVDATNMTTLASSSRRSISRQRPAVSREIRYRRVAIPRQT